MTFQLFSQLLLSAFSKNEIDLIYFSCGLIKGSPALLYSFLFDELGAFLQFIKDTRPGRPDIKALSLKVESEHFLVDTIAINFALVEKISEESSKYSKFFDMYKGSIFAKATQILQNNLAEILGIVS